MSWIDWCIVVVPLTIVICLAFYAKKFARSAVDFLASGRVAGRYLICVGDLTVALSVITIVASSEQNYQTGYGVGFWGAISTPIWMMITLTGYCSYRWRQARVLSKGQFIELRYGSKSFRVATAIVSTLAEMITNSIGPAIAANFFIYYLKLPHSIMIFGISLPCYVILVALCLTLAMLIIWPAGRISLLITDSFQGILTYPIFVLICGFIMLKFGWDTDITPILWDRVPHESFINPYDVENMRDFNVFALVVSIVAGVLNMPSWYGNDTSNSGKSPHEQKMAGILGSWRNGFSFFMISLLAMMIYTFMNNGNFSERGDKQRFSVTNDDIRRELSVRVLDEVIQNDPGKKAEIEQIIYKLPDQHHVIGVDKPLSQAENLDTMYFNTMRKALGDTPEGRFQYQKFRSLYYQMMMPTVLSNILPVGLIGLFCLLMVLLLISTDDTRIFNAAGCLVQDVILPFYKRKLEPKEHIALLRFTALGVAIFFFIVAIFFQSLDYINMLTVILCALWQGGAAPIMVGGLYTRFGNVVGAWGSMIFGCGSALVGVIFQRNWADIFYPFFEEHGMVPGLDKFLRTCSSPLEPWVHWEMNPIKFPINSYELLAISMILAIIAYVIGSYATYKPFNLDKLLHRGIYSDGDSIPPEPWSWKNIFSKIITITPEYTTGDKIIAWSVFFYSFVWNFFLWFIVIIIWNSISPWTQEGWNIYFYIKTIIVNLVIGIISTVWFMYGGIRDLRQLFIDLEKRVVDKSDNGQVDKVDLQ